MEQKESVLPERGALRRVVLRLLVPRSILGLPSELRGATWVTNRATSTRISKTLGQSSLASVPMQ